MNIKDNHKFWEGFANMYDNAPLPRSKRIANVEAGLVAMITDLDPGHMDTKALWSTLAHILSIPRGNDQPHVGMLMEFLIQGIVSAEHAGTESFYKTLVDAIECIKGDNKRRLLENILYEFEYGEFCDPQFKLVENLVKNHKIKEYDEWLYPQILFHIVVNSSLHDLRLSVLQNLFDQGDKHSACRTLFWEIQNILRVRSPQNWAALLTGLRLKKSAQLDPMIDITDDTVGIQQCEIIQLLMIEFCHKPFESFGRIACLLSFADRLSPREMICSAWKSMDIKKLNLNNLKKASRILNEIIPRPHGSDPDLEITDETIYMFFSVPSDV